MQQHDKRDECIKNIKYKYDELLEKQSDLIDKIPNEILYGLAGYLLALINVYNYIHNSNANTTNFFTHQQCNSNQADRSLKLSVHLDNIINNLYELAVKLIKDGKNYSKIVQSDQPYMLEWHDKEYVGAAHGIFGILYALFASGYFQHPTPQIYKFLEASLDSLSKLQFPSTGNFPSSLPVGSDKLVQWCHGAPGVIYTYLKAAQIFPDKRTVYLDIALKCGECVWERGILTKGYGLCHGISGNAYAFLALYNYTKDDMHLHRAYKFAEYIENYGKHNFRVPDTPYSLYEGMAGPIVFLSDLIWPELACFPMYEPFAFSK